MAHISGNPTWQDYPSTTTKVTATTLENIENALDTARSSAPSLVGSRTGSYSKAHNVYTPTALSMRSLRAQLGLAYTGSLVNMVTMGDSKTAGVVVGAYWAWPSISRQLFAWKGLSSAGTGLVMCANNAIDSRLSYTGTWTTNAPFIYASTTNTKATFASDSSGTVVDVYFYNNSGSFTVAIDGGTAVSVTRSGTNSVGKYTVTGLSNAAHTVVLNTTSATTVYVIGFCVRQTSGLLIHNLGVGGRTSTGLTSTVFSDVQAITTFIAPSILGLEIGINDPSAGINASTTSSNINTILTTNNPSVPAKFLLTQLAAPTTNQTQWGVYVSGMYDQADSLGIPLLDLNDRQGVPTDATSAGLIGGDNIHETVAGQYDVSRGVVEMLCS